MSEEKFKKLEALLNEAASLAREIDPASSVVLHSLLGAVYSQTTLHLATITAEFSQLIINEIKQKHANIIIQ